MTEQPLRFCKAGAMLYSETDPFWSTECGLPAPHLLYIRGDPTITEPVPLCVMHLSLLQPGAQPVDPAAN